MRISFIRYVVAIALALTAAGAVADRFDNVTDAFSTIAAFPGADAHQSR